MPGSSYIRGNLVQQALTCQRLFPRDIDDRAREVLKLVNKVLPLGIPERAEEKALDTKETARALRDIAAASIVLMKNERNVLPFSKEKSVRVLKLSVCWLILNRSLLSDPTQKSQHTAVEAPHLSDHTMPSHPMKASQLKPNTSNMHKAAPATSESLSSAISPRLQTAEEE
jgi:beta-glucosidase-like glycosyl hydrolase